MDYYAIGEKIRKYRKAYHLSQEQLAEKIGISVTHMSHIETGNTKLSLSVLLDIADALDLQTDDLLREQPSGKAASVQAIAEVLDQCSEKQIRILCDIIISAKQAMDKYGD